ncbi:hypothetical protein RI129_003460 [Pyrocoelia pectoralis]|uniref:Luciferin 4-monooxygenase n=1 Tax=Pyrocoelia pectoralis TaxID=417401 RepID=A0AAN7VRQ2_9COLE
MINDDQYILYGPNEEYFINYQSLGEYLLDCLRKRDYDDIIAVDPESEEQLTCGKLLEKSVRLATVLERMGVTKGDGIAIVSENNINYYIPILASLYLGAIFNPLNVEYTYGELKHAIDLSKPKVIFSSFISLRKILRLKEECNYINEIVLMTQSLEVLDNIKTMESALQNVIVNVQDFRVDGVGLSDHAALFMSSGTTGLPKCVGLSHGNFIGSLSVYRDPRYLNVSNDVTVSVIPFFHIYGFLTHISAVFCTLKVVLMKKLESELFLRAIKNYKCTRLFLVPTLLQYFVQNSKVNSDVLSSVKFIHITAAALGNTVYQAALQKLKHITVIQMYGTTETAGACTVQKVTDNINTIGYLVPNIICKLVNPNTHRTLRPFQYGELCFKGINVMKGYYNNPTETCTAIDSDGFYHTGDVGYYNENGQLFIIDRIKDIIKYKGFQVAPAELENLILNHNKVQECGVIGIPDEKAGELPLAFIVPKPGVKLSAEEIVKFVSENISSQKHLHGGVKFVKKIPKTSSGKISRLLLREIYNESIGQ